MHCSAFDEVFALGFAVVAVVWVGIRVFWFREVWGRERDGVFGHEVAEAWLRGDGAVVGL